jgi:hypothetical protein
MATSFRSRRRPLKPKRCIQCVAFTCTLGASLAFAQAPTPTKVTLDEAIQMAVLHNHTLLAARTTIQQSQAEETTANLGN